MTLSIQGNNSERVLAFCGIAAPILFTILVFIGGLLRPGYSQLSQTISRLGEAGTSNATFTDANFVVTGLLITAFVGGLYRSLLQGKSSKVGLALILAFPVTLVLQGTFFPYPNPIHVLLGYGAFIITVIGLFVVSRGLRKDGQWKGFSTYTIVTGAVLVTLFLILFAGQDALAPWFGLLQRTALAPIFLWIEVMAVRLYLVSSARDL